MLLKKIVFLCLFLVFPYLFCPGSYLNGEGDPVIAPKGYHGARYFGSLATEYTIDRTGKSTLCTLYVSTVLVGIQALTATSPTYDFDVKAGLDSARGSFTLSLVDSPMVSKLSAKFNYSVSANNTSFTFKGDMVGWYATNDNRAK
jgi:hypothetical protein